jgi:hypothetical protein
LTVEKQMGASRRRFSTPPDAWRILDLVNLVSVSPLKPEEPAFGLPVITFVSPDSELLDAAKVEELLVENPNYYL